MFLLIKNSSNLLFTVQVHPLLDSVVVDDDVTFIWPEINFSVLGPAYANAVCHKFGRWMC